MHAMRIVSTIALLTCTVAAESGAQPVATDRNQQPLPSWFLGTWEREWIRISGVTDNTMTVRFVQTPTMFGDVRIPSDRPRFAHATSLADLTLEELAALAKQRGFFGYTTLEGDVATWHHEVDYQPAGAAGDMGRLERVGGSGMYEHALDDSYVESWWSLGSGDGKYLVVRVTKLVHDVQRLDRVLLVAGDHFAYARNRAKELPAADSLSALVTKGDASLETLRDYLDCELSHGYVRGGTVPWEIVNSTLPWREGSHLELADEIVLDARGQLSALEGPGETWTFPLNSMSKEDLAVLFPSTRN
jgi:hypothetical protein